jgi:hypothetical protein
MKRQRPSLRLLVLGALAASPAASILPPVASAAGGAPALLTAEPPNATIFYGASRIVYLTLTDAAGAAAAGEHVRVELYRDTNRDGRYNLIRIADKVIDDAGHAFAATSHPRYIGNDAVGVTLDLLVACVGTADCGAVAADPDGNPLTGENSTVAVPAAPGLVAGARTQWLLPAATLTFDSASLARTYGASAGLGLSVRDATGRGVGGVAVRFELYRDTNGNGLANRMAVVSGKSDTSGRLGLQYSLAAYQGSDPARRNDDTLVACTGSSDCAVASDPNSLTAGEDTTLALPGPSALTAAATVRWSP